MGTTITTVEIEAVEAMVINVAEAIKTFQRLRLTKEAGDPSLGLRDHLGTLTVNLRHLASAAVKLARAVDVVRS